jgi:N-acetylglutamate synthase-like GNAT family acetyltransferase
MNIRKAREKDRNRCLEIIVSCLREINSQDYDDDVINRLVEKYKENFMEMPGVSIFIVEREEQILGTAAITTQGQIRDVFIDIAQHRKGLGTRLMEKLEDIAKTENLEKVFLFAALSSVDFYKKLDYIITERLDFGKEGIQIKMEKEF